MHARPENPFELGDSRWTTLPQRQGSQTHDCCHERSFWFSGNPAARDPSRSSVDPVPSAPQSRPGRYAQFDAGQLADAVELAFERDEIPDWELVFELSRRAMSAESVQPAVGVAQTA